MAAPPILLGKLSRGYEHGFMTDLKRVKTDITKTVLTPRFLSGVGGEGFDTFSNSVCLSHYLIPRSHALWLPQREDLRSPAPSPVGRTNIYIQ